MEQKDYIYEIVGYLLKNNKGHVRGIAKVFGVNHMIILRKMNLLLGKNVVDFKREGKNKVFFLKKTIEARNYVFMTESYKLIQLLGKYPQLRKIIEKIQEDKRVKLAILFGSYAKGIAKKDSDIDVYLETENTNLKREFNLFSSRINIKIGKYDKGSLLIQEIDKNHVLLKGVERYYEKRGVFKESS